MNELEFNIIEWFSKDDETQEENSNDEVYNEEHYKMYMFGRTEKGESVECIVNNFNPYYYVKIPETTKSDKFILNSMIKHIKQNYWKTNSKKYRNILVDEECEIIRRKDIYGFTNEKEFRFIKLVFSSKRSMNTSRYYLFKEPITIMGINKNKMKYKLYESNFEPYMRFAHIQNIKMAGWVKVKGSVIEKTSDKIKLECNWKNVVGIEKNTVAPFLQMSWDIEVYSYDYTFPNPEMKIKKDGKDVYPNEIYQIGITLKSYGEKGIKKMLLTSKWCPPIEDAIVINCETETGLINAFIDVMSKEDPDILYGYNTDCFDFEYLVKRCSILGMKKDLLRGLSRSKDLECVLKKEQFSSSAYGDSEFNRLYIPGRLNYDLLIHYKRGMKKYSSYKLDNIAHEILGERKNDVEVKSIFKSYESGIPEEIKKIGEYCIQDTVLLQNLVDKQIILINIVQLANVTWVPIGYLVTKGQTIKVLSQIMKKSREMGYLVPHTNFNSDNNVLTLKLKREYEMEELTSMVGNYIKIDCGKKDWEYEGKKISKEYIINGLIEEIIDEKTINIKTDTSLEDGEVVRYIKRGICNNRLLEINSISVEDIVDDSFTGATVLEPKKGLYLDDIVVLDFASLYPTIMISRNLCFSSLVDIEEWSEEKLKAENIKYEVIEWKDTISYKLNKKCEKVMTSGKRDGEICNKDANVKVDSYSMYYCEEHKEIDSIQIQEETCDRIVKNSICNKKAKWTDGISYYCERCKKAEVEEYNNENLVGIVNKCEYCGKIARWKLDIHKDTYFCLIHDPYKSTREEDEKKLEKEVYYRYVIVQPEGIKNKGVVPSLLEDLYKARKDVKKQMNQAKDDKLLKDILDMQQLAIKISLNSVYGFMGRTKGNLVKGELGRLTTAVGRMLIEKSKEFVEEEYNNTIKGRVKCSLKCRELSDEKYKKIKQMM